MKYKFKKGWVIIGGVFFILVALNPGMKRFKEFSGLDNKEMGHVKRTYNFIVCSVYEDTYNEEKYFGVLLNFIDITPKKQPQPSDTTVILNSSDTVTVNPFIPIGQGTVKMVFPDGSIGDINKADINLAIKSGAKLLIEDSLHILKK